MRARPLFLMVVLTLAAMARPAFAINPRAEAAALDALQKAEGDFLGMNYASGAARLDKALRACAPANCSANTQAALLRDIGTMEFRAGDRGFATKAFTEALKIQPNIDLNPSYDAPELRALWNEVKGVGGGAPVGGPPAGGAPGGTAAAPPPMFQQPKGDFIHTPAAEQRYDTPLPIFVEGGPNGVAHVIVRFKSSEDSEEAEWQHMDLSRVGPGWGGQIPCSAVLSGTVRYYIQGYNKDMDPIATNGEAKNPYQVPIRDELSGPPPHLPNRAPPRMCHPPKKAEAAAPPARERETDRESEDTGETSKEDCPPGMPGCGKNKKVDEDEEAKSDEDEGEEGKGEGEGKKKKKKQFPRIWIGLSLHVDFMQLPSGNDVCRLHPRGSPQAGLPANDKHFYCTDPNGYDFPTRNDPPPAMPGDQNNQLTQLNAGQAGGGVALGNVRVIGSLDYAVTSNIMIGGRVGWVFLTYPGAAAVKDNYAWGQKFYLEARLTGFIGKDPLKKGTLAPMIYGGGGLSSFDAHTTTSPSPRLCAMPTIACSPAMVAMPRDVPADAWITNGPGFVAIGGGLRYAAARQVGLLGSLRVNLSFGNNGLIPTVGPEIGLQYGF